MEQFTHSKLYNLNNIFSEEQLDKFLRLRSRIPPETGYCYFPRDENFPTPGRCHYQNMMSGKLCSKPAVGGTNCCPDEKHKEKVKMYGLNITSYPIIFVINKNKDVEYLPCHIDTDLLMVTFPDQEKMTIDQYFNQNNLSQITPVSYLSKPNVAIVTASKKSDIKRIEYVGGKIIYDNHTEGYYIAKISDIKCNENGEFEILDSYVRSLKFNPTCKKKFISNGKYFVKTYFAVSKFLTALSILKKFNEMELITYESLMSYGRDVKLSPKDRRPIKGVTYHTLWTKEELHRKNTVTNKSVKVNKSEAKSIMQNQTSIPPKPIESTPFVMNTDPSFVFQQTESHSVVTNPVQIPTSNPVQISTPNPIQTPEILSAQIPRSHLIQILTSNSAQTPTIHSIQTVAKDPLNNQEIIKALLQHNLNVIKTSDPEKLYIKELNVVTDIKFTKVLGSASRLDDNNNIIDFKKEINIGIFHTTRSFLELDFNVKIIV